jgi:uncharacterized membrane protein
MPKTRLEAFSDGVIAILITIMVLELHTPEGTSWHALEHQLPALSAYVLSFVYVGIYWSNHHHMLAVVARVSGAGLWANLHLLALGRDRKGKLSAVLYSLAIGLAFADRWISVAIYVAVALIWLVPDPRVERHLATAPGE